MNYLIIGDVHGCFYTVRKLLEQCWGRNNDCLIFLGDLVNKGKNSFEVLLFLYDLQKNNADKVIILKGNNEELFTEKYKAKKTDKAEKKFKKHGLDFKTTIDWLNNLPHFWENEFIFCSHAGVSMRSDYPPEEKNKDLLYNRLALKNIGKRQYLGHIVVQRPKFNEKSNAWYLDTGAGYGKYLSAIKLTEKGDLLDIYSFQVSEDDIPY